ncbi:MAG: hypothetical protein IT356_07355 [Gemmatimonadaceae bacterium]|nr:hypothetical protein [Gemmatimonadaceae bacterium]
MATQLADILFVILAAAIVVSQALILRSTARGMRHGIPGDRVALEWAYAIIPAVALAALLVATWAAMHPATVDVRGVAPVAGL